jgi:hypothetical protein
LKILKKLFLLFVILHFFNADGQHIIQKLYKNPSGGTGYDMVKTNDGGVLIAGSASNPSNTSITAGMLLKLDSAGSYIWSKLIYDQPLTSYNTQIENILQLSNGKLFIQGKSYIPSTTTAYQWLMLYDSLGNVSKQVSLKWPIGSGFPIFNDVIENSDGDIVLCGDYFSGFNMGGFYNKRFLVMTVDTSLVIQWTKEFYYQLQEEFVCIKNCPDGNLILQGITLDTIAPSKDHVILLKINSSGDIIWAKQIGTDPPSGVTSPYTGSGSIDIMTNGTIFNTFTTNWFRPSFQDIILQRLDSDGNDLISTQFFMPGDSPEILVEDSNNIYIKNGWELVKTNSFPNIVWKKSTLNSSITNFGIGTPFFKTNENTLAFSYLNNSSFQSGSIYLVLEDTSGNIGCNPTTYLIPSSQMQSMPSIDIGWAITENILTVSDSVLSYSFDNALYTDTLLCDTYTIVPELFDSKSLISAYPNPSSDYINFTSSKNLNGLTVEVLDILSRKIATETIQENRISVNKLHTGIYFIAIIIGNSKKMVKVIKL